MSPKQRTAYGIEYSLLGFLRDAPLHGYELWQRMATDAALRSVWRLKQAHLYAILARLEADDLIIGEQIPQPARPPKRLLRLTPSGRSAFEQWRQTPVQHGRDLRIEFLAKLFWAQQDSPATARNLITAQQGLCEQWLANLHALPVDAFEQPYAVLVGEFRRHQIAAVIEWLHLCARLVAERPE